jgi:hypothetical protein
MTEVTFQWNSGGNDVKIAGSFNSWVPTQMIKSGEKWIYRTKLDSGNHTYKFIADGNWYYDSKLPSLVDDKQVTNNVMVIDNNNYKATSLISITNNNLQLKNIISNMQTYKDDNIKVVSILGSARMGKSTLLNTIISKYNNYNNNVFTTSKSSTNYCTNGIDFVYVPGLKIVFCDVQGLNHDNSSNDPKLLLVTYLMSDIIIFTEPKMLNKNTLQTLSPLASFLTYLDAQQIDSNNSKPSLVFRISDFTLAGKPEDNLNKLLVENNDQHKNLIINMKKLFKDIKAFKTEQLDRSELKMLDANNFIGLLESDDNGFNGFISELNEYLDKVPSKFNFQKWYKNLDKFIVEINMNNKIDFNKLDIYYQIAEKELLEYENLLRETKPEIFTAMKVNHSQKDLDNIIKIRVKIRDNIDNEFKSKFKVVNDNIKKTRFDKLISGIDKHIKDAIDSNKDQGMKIMTDYTKANFNKVDIKQLTLVAGDLDLTACDKFLISNDINENVVSVYNTWKKQINESYKKKKNAIIDLQKIEINKYYNKMKDYKSGFIDSVKISVLLNNFKNKDDIKNFLLTSFETFKNDLVTKNIDSINGFITDLIQYYMTVDLNKTKKNFNEFDLVFGITNNKVDENYQYFKEIYDFTKTELFTLVNNKKIEKYFKTKKMQLLMNTKYYKPVNGQLSSDVARINDDICKFYNIYQTFIPIYQVKNKYLIKQTCEELAKNKLLLKTTNGLVFNGLVYGSYTELFNKIHMIRTNDDKLQIVNNYVIVFFDKVRELCIKRENYKLNKKILKKRKNKTKIENKKDLPKIDKIQCTECLTTFGNVNEETLYQHIKFKHSQLSIKTCFPTFVKN